MCVYAYIVKLWNYSVIYQKNNATCIPSRFWNALYVPVSRQRAKPERFTVTLLPRTTNKAGIRVSCRSTKYESNICWPLMHFAIVTASLTLMGKMYKTCQPIEITGHWHPIVLCKYSLFFARKSGFDPSFSNWLVVWIPLKNDGVRQLGLWHSQHMESHNPAMYIYIIYMYIYIYSITRSLITIKSPLRLLTSNQPKKQSFGK